MRLFFNFLSKMRKKKEILTRFYKFHLKIKISLFRVALLVNKKVNNHICLHTYFCSLYQREIYLPLFLHGLNLSSKNFIVYFSVGSGHDSSNSFTFFASSSCCTRTRWSSGCRCGKTIYRQSGIKWIQLWFKDYLSCPNNYLSCLND